jgi:hypothetical protein
MPTDPERSRERGEEKIEIGLQKTAGDLSQLALKKQMVNPSGLGDFSLGMSQMAALSFASDNSSSRWPKSALGSCKKFQSSAADLP